MVSDLRTWALLNSACFKHPEKKTMAVFLAYMKLGKLAISMTSGGQL